MSQVDSLALASAPHEQGLTTTGRMMRILMLSLIPAFLVQMYFFGWGIFVNTILTLVTCLVTEGIILKLRGHHLNRLWRDSSAMVTAVLLGFALPPLLPWYLTVIGSFFAIAIVKQAFGGLGQNIFNPAMGGFVFLLISSPLAMTEYIDAVPANWNNVTLSRATAIIFNIDRKNQLEEAHIDAFNAITNSQESRENIDAIRDGLTGATFLVDAKHEQPLHHVNEYTQQHLQSFKVYNLLAHTIISVAILFCGVVLLVFRVINYRICVSFLGTIIILGGICYYVDPKTYLPVWYHCIFGATMFGAFYIVTDPVTAVAKPLGAYIFGITTGVIFIIIRNFGGYPDAVAFSVLLGNAVAPLIDVMTRRREFGAHSKPGDLFND